KFSQVLSAVAAVALAALVVAAPVSANRRPALTVTPTVTGTSAVVTVLMNRGEQQVGSCTYVLDGAKATDCGAQTDGDKKNSTFEIPLAGLQGGPHNVTVPIPMGEGNGGATGSASFTVVSGPRVFALAFTNVDGVTGYDPTHDVLIAK